MSARHNRYRGGYAYVTPVYERKIIDHDTTDYWPVLVNSDYGLTLRKSGSRYYIADTYKGFRVTPWKRISVLRLAELLAHYEAYTLTETTVSMRLEV